MLIKPLKYKTPEGNLVELDDAGAGSAWVLERLMAIGYFSDWGR